GAAEARRAAAGTRATGASPDQYLLDHPGGTVRLQAEEAAFARVPRLLDPRAAPGGLLARGRAEPAALSDDLPRRRAGPGARRPGERRRRGPAAGPCGLDAPLAARMDARRASAARPGHPGDSRGGCRAAGRLPRGRR